MKNKLENCQTLISALGFSIIGGTGRDDISMQLASRDFRPCWIYTWVAVKLLPRFIIRLYIYLISFLGLKGRKKLYSVMQSDGNSWKIDAFQEAISPELMITTEF